jgi:hypothetical protein
METRMTIKFSDITGGGIPYGDNAGRPANPGIGKLYSNGEAARLELYTSTGWQNIVQEVPGVASIVGTYSEATNSGTIIIQGTNFVSGAIASAIGSNGVQVDATSTTYNSLVQLTATFNGLSNQYEPYDIKVTNPSNLFGLIPDALYVNASPVWQTSAGSLGTFNEQVSVSVSATATDSDSTITYALASGSSLPSGLSLNSSTGAITGTLPDVTSDTTYSFTINASDGLNIIPRAFSITSLRVYGLSAEGPFPSKSLMSSYPSGTYWVKFDGMQDAVQTYFDNSTAGGGWLLAFTVTNANGKLVNWWNNDTSMPGNSSNTPNYFTSTSTLGSTATMSKSNAKNGLFNTYSFSDTMIVENHNGTIGKKAYTLSSANSYLGWFQNTGTHDTFTNRVSSVIHSEGTMRAFNTNQLDFNLQLSGAPGDGGRIVPEGPINECVGGISTRTDGNNSYSYGWSGNLLRNDSGRAYATDGSTSDHTAWVFVR